MKLEQCWFELNIQRITDCNNRRVKADRQRKVRFLCWYYVFSEQLVQLSNMCEELEVSVSLSLWVIVKVRASLPLYFTGQRVPGICQESFNQWRSSNRNLFYDGNNPLETRNQTKCPSWTNICVIFAQTKAQAQLLRFVWIIAIYLMGHHSILQYSH